MEILPALHRRIYPDTNAIGPDRKQPIAFPVNLNCFCPAIQDVCPSLPSMRAANEHALSGWPSIAQDTCKSGRVAVVSVADKTLNNRQYAL